MPNKRKLIEVYRLTGLEHPQPCAREIDLTKPEEELLDELKVTTGQEINSIATMPHQNQAKHGGQEQARCIWGRDPGCRASSFRKL